MQDQRRISLRPPQLAPPQYSTNLSTNSSTPSPYNPLDQRNNISFNASYNQPRLSRSHQFMPGMPLMPSPLSSDFTRQPQMRQSLLLPSLGGTGGDRTLMPNRSAFLPTVRSPLSTFAPQHNPQKFFSPQVSPLALKTINMNPAPSQTTHTSHTMTSDRGDLSADRYPRMGERNLMKYLEKQTAVMERLTERVNKQIKTDIGQRERDQMGVRTIESKVDVSLRNQDNIEQRRPRKSTYDDTSIMFDTNIMANNSSLIYNNNSSNKRPSIIITSETPKKETNALETIGQLYLMGKLPSSPGALQVLENKSLETPDLRKTQTKSTPVSILKKSDTVESINHSSQNDDSSSSGSASGSLSEVEEEDRTILIEEKPSPRRSQARNVVSPKRERRYLRDRRDQLDIPSYEKAYNSGRTSRTEANLDNVIERPRPKAKSIIKLPNKDGVRSRSGSVATAKPRKSVRIVEPGEQEQFNRQIRKAKRETLRMKAQTYLWMLLYPRVLAKTVEKKALTRRENISQAICLNYETHFANAEAFLVSAGEKYLRELVSETKSLELFCYKKPLNDKVLDVRIAFIAERIKGLCDKLITRTTSDALGRNLIHFLISMSENNGVLPRDFMFDFEAKRLQFTYYGTLKYMTPHRSKMMVGSFILLRILIHKIILRPWTVFYDMKKSKTNKQNLITIASILYYLTTGIYKRNLALQHNNQCFLTPETRVKPRSNPLQALDEVVEVDEETAVKQKEAIKDSEPEAITGLIPKEMLKSLFSDRRKIAEELKACLEGWHDKIYEITHEEYCSMTGKQREKLVS